MNYAFIAFSQQLDTAVFYKQIAIAGKYFNANKLDSAKIIYNQAINNYESKNNPSILDSLSVSKYAMCFFELFCIETKLKNEITAQNHFNKAEGIIANRFGTNSNPQIALYNRLADFYVSIKDDEKLLEADNKGLAFLQNQKDNTNRISRKLMEIGIDYQSMGEPAKAIEYLKQSELNYIAKLDTDKNFYIKQCINYGAVYESLSDRESAIKYLEKGISIFEAFPSAPTKTLADATKLYQNVATNLWREKRYDMALAKATKALDIKTHLIAKDSTQIKNLDIAKTYNLIGQIHTSKKEYDLAETALKKAIEHNNKVGIDNISNYKEYGNTLRLKGEHNIALLYSDSSLLPFVQNNNLNPPMRFKPYSIAKGRLLIEVLLVRAEILQAIFEKNQKSDYLSKANELISTSLLLADKLIEQANIQASKENLQTAILPIYERALRLTQLKYEAEKNISALNETFALMERSKAMTLLQAVNATKAEQYFKVPSIILEQEKNINKKITDTEIRLFNQEKNAKDSVGRKISEKELIDLKREKENWTQTIKQNYPDYFKLRLNRTPINIDSLRLLLNSNQSLIEYFVGDSSIYILFINPFNTQLKTVKNDFLLNGWVDTFRTSMKSIEGAAYFTDKSYGLYQKLILPIKQFLPQRDSGQKPNQLIIIPDGVLGYLPFEALLTQSAKNPTHYASHKYLIDDYIVSYNFSATLFDEMQHKQHVQKPTTTFIGFAPFFYSDTTAFANLYSSANRGGGENSWGSLINSGEEIYHTRLITNGRAYINKEASSENFKKSANSARIIHLATHGKADDKDSGFSFLVFASQRANILYDSLFVKDIYNQTLNADMVVLSACETGIGKLQRGEGIVSLSRSFAYSGAKSIFYTLWVANDVATKDLMVNFYRNLKKGMTKDAALWQAKIAYLYKAKENAKGPNHIVCNPFFWASFVGTGDMQAMKF